MNSTLNILDKNYLNGKMDFESIILNNRDVKVAVLQTKVDIYNDIARFMIDKIKKNNSDDKKTVFILPVGPRGQYIRFAKICNDEKINCRNLITINMDEYISSEGNLIAFDHPVSFRRFMFENLFSLLDKNIALKKENIYFPDPYNLSEIFEVITDLGGVDTCFAGVGINGHIAFNEPVGANEITIKEFKNKGTRILELSKETIIMNSLKYGGDFSLIPKKCITIGMKEILLSRQIRVYFEHDWQSSILYKAVFYKPTTEIPITLIKEHPSVIYAVSQNVTLNNHVF